jgi:hypothetical protein
VQSPQASVAPTFSQAQPTVASTPSIPTPPPSFVSRDFDNASIQNSLVDAGVTVSPPVVPTAVRPSEQPTVFEQAQLPKAEAKAADLKYDDPFKQPDDVKEVKKEREVGGLEIRRRNDGSEKTDYNKGPCGVPCNKMCGTCALSGMNGDQLAPREQTVTLGGRTIGLTIN